MAQLIEVAFRGNRKEFFRWEEEAALSLKTAVIVEADRGEDLGHVHSTGELAEVRCKGCPHGCGTTPPPRRALRVASVSDQVTFAELKAENENARQRAMERVKANGLVMKLTDAEWQWDRKKLTFFFTSDRRVDFRALVRDLASMFRTRIELKQIGVRDEAKRLSGIGRCGREYCSSSWLPDLRPVNLAVAKDQKLSLNPSQISGACGRLMCCLRYEHEFYVQSRRRFPKEGKLLQTSIGEEKVLSCDIFHERVTLRSSDGDTRVVPLADLRAELEATGQPLPVERVMETELPSLATEEFVLSETTEFMIATDVVMLDEPLVQSSVPVAADINGDDDDDDGADDDAADDDVDEAPIDASGPSVTSPPTAAQPGAEPRRKRRRGRRGGRRLRGPDGRGPGDRDPGDGDPGDRGPGDRGPGDRGPDSPSQN